MISTQHRSDQSKINQALKLHYVLKIAADYFNEIALLYFAVDLLLIITSATKSNPYHLAYLIIYLSIYAGKIQGLNGCKRLI